MFKWCSATFPAPVVEDTSHSANSKDYRHLIGPEDRYDPDDEGPVNEPPTLEVLSQFWQSARTSAAAFKAFTLSPPGGSESAVLLAYSIDQRGQNFLHMAAVVGDPHTILLLKRVFPDRHGRRPQYIQDLEERLPRQRDVDGNMPIHIAAANDNLNFAKALMDYHVAGYTTDPVDLYIPSERQEYISRSEIRHVLPLLDSRNKAGRTAAQEAWKNGARTTGQWLDDFRWHLVGDEPQSEEAEEDDDNDALRDHLVHSSSSREVLQVICACGAMMVAMLLFDLARS